MRRTSLSFKAARKLSDQVICAAGLPSGSLGGGSSTMPDTRRSPASWRWRRPGGLAIERGRSGGQDLPWKEANGVSIHYQLAGARGPVVVLLHELGGTLDSWDAVAPGLSDSFRVLH